MHLPILISTGFFHHIELYQRMCYCLKLGHRSCTGISVTTSHDGQRLNLIRISTTLSMYILYLGQNYHYLSGCCNFIFLLYNLIIFNKCPSVCTTKTPAFLDRFQLNFQALSRKGFNLYLAKTFFTLQNETTHVNKTLSYPQIYTICI